MSKINDRKLQHIQIVRDENVEPIASSFNKFNWPYQSFPEINFREIDTEVQFESWKLSFPFFISSMTGGPELGEKINRHVAEACEEVGVGFGLGSMRVILRKPETIPSFDVKKFAPSVPMFANFGLIQLNYGYNASDINKIVDIVDADGIFLHLNPLQEIIQPEGDTNWEGLLNRLEEELPKIERPVIIKEVGHGIDFKSMKRLEQMGAKWVDVSGLGGTSWAGVEAYRRDDEIGHLFADIGIPTDKLLTFGKQETPKLNMIAGGGVRNGLHIAKSIALGASLATAAKPFLEASLTSTEEIIKVLRRFKKELEISMFVAGVRDIEGLSKLKLENVN